MNSYIYTAPFGKLYITADETYVTQISFSPITKEHGNAKPNALVQKLFDQLDQYFAGTLTQFDIPLAPTGTDFQKNVWQALTEIPFGDTASYKDIATRLNNEKAVRAVGGANNKNPLPIVIPCHRVIGQNGKLVGFAGGLETKSWLLNHEKQYA